MEKPRGCMELIGKINMEKSTKSNIESNWLILGCNMMQLMSAQSRHSNRKTNDERPVRSDITQDAGLLVTVNH